ncbi:hypothetical protein NE237_031785 [Protea cynaroides]|uniref:RING-type domain-containing protein n=1 Tax=Protea cynaroides TaxID=273540 RepID=A0A9Q0L1U6_9MAGN|nr:hypothetical protein NE237_031785 [Protea cynaroides]
MLIFLQVKLRADHGSCEGSDNLESVEPKASFRFIMEREDIVESSTSNGGATTLETRSVGWVEKEFDVDFFHLLLPITNEISIKDLLIQFWPLLSPATIEGGLKQQISRYALKEAMLCKERRAPFLNIIVCFTAYCIEDVDPMLMDIVDGLKINSFDDEDRRQFSTCMVCMDEFVKGVVIVKLPCTHFFHGECIFKWLKHKKSCPICRFAFPAKESTDNRNIILIL